MTRYEYSFVCEWVCLPVKRKNIDLTNLRKKKYGKWRKMLKSSRIMFGDMINKLTDLAKECEGRVTLRENQNISQYCLGGNFEVLGLNEIKRRDAQSLSQKLSRKVKLGGKVKIKLEYPNWK